MNPIGTAAVTGASCSAAPRRASAYLAAPVAALAARPRARPHGLRQRGPRLCRAAGADKLRVVAERAPHLALVTAYNDMLSAHQPYEATRR
jgi:phosphogluconate dehydratase